ncbi:hypothetical protein V2J09_022347 [Rumex salicifolius]
MADGTRSQVQNHDLQRQLDELKLDSEKKHQDLLDAISRLTMAQPPPTPPTPPSPSSIPPTHQQSGGELSNPGHLRADLTRSGGSGFARNQELATGENPLFPGGLTGRIEKVSFPKFDGTLFREWIYRCEQFFTLDNTLPEMKVRLASMHMIGSKALTWHHNYIKGRYGHYPNWPEYVIDMSARFGELYDDPLSDLVNLKHEGSVDDFLDKFECALGRLNLSNEHALSIFLANLQPHLQMHVRQFKPKTLGEAACIAKLHEGSLQLTPSQARYPSHKPNTSYNRISPLLPTSTPLPNKPPQNNLIPFKNTQNHFTPNPRGAPAKTTRKYSFEEMQERKAKGLCMFCEEQFTPGHQLKHRRTQIYVMECDEEVDDEVEKEPDIAEIESLHLEELEDAPLISVAAMRAEVEDLELAT